MNPAHKIYSQNQPIENDVDHFWLHEGNFHEILDLKNIR